MVEHRSSLPFQREGSPKLKNMYYVYLLKLNNTIKQYYIGSTPNVVRRILKHKKGDCLYTKKYLPVKLLYFECYNNKELALDREKQLKNFGSAYYALLKRLKLK